MVSGGKFDGILQEYSAQLTQAQSWLEEQDALLEKRIDQFGEDSSSASEPEVSEPVEVQDRAAQSPSSRRMQGDDDEEFRFRPKSWFI